MECLLESCICDSTNVPQLHLQYFNWLVQVVSVRSNSTYQGNGRSYVLRVWDGHPITSAHRLVGTMSSKQSQEIVAAASHFEGVPESFFFDVILFGEWISRATTLESGAVIILKNVHLFVANNYKLPVLVMHEGTSHRRDMVEVDMDRFARHYCCVRLMSNINRVMAQFPPKKAGNGLESVCSQRISSQPDENQITCAEEHESNLSDLEGIPEERLAALKQAFTWPSNPNTVISPIKKPP